MKTFSVNKVFPFWHKVSEGTLTTRFAAAVALLVVVTAALISIASIVFQQQSVENIISEREATAVAQIAHEIDNNLMLRRDALIRSASDIASVVPHDRQHYQEWLNRHHMMKSFFSNLVVIDRRGHQIANLSDPTSGEVDLSDREYFRQTLRTNAAIISAPLQSAISGRPVIVLTAPIRNNNGELVAILAGTIDLARDSFIRDLSDVKIGKSGYYFIVSRQGCT
ncbi:PDC sensor domain-containing protein [Massilia cavernae]|nr:cache domain-containing protein [Massilia cavernae]